MGFGLLQGLGTGFRDFAQMWGEIPEQQRERQKFAMLQEQHAREGELAKDTLETNKLGRKATQLTIDRTSWQHQQEQEGAKREEYVRRFWGRPLDERAQAEIAAWNPQALRKNEKGEVVLNETTFMSPADYATYQEKVQTLLTAKAQYERDAKFGDLEAQARLDALEADIARNKSAMALQATQAKTADLVYQRQLEDFEQGEHPEVKAERDHRLAADLETFNTLAKETNAQVLGTANVKYGPNGQPISASTPGERNTHTANQVRAHLLPLADSIARRWAEITSKIYADRNQPLPNMEQLIEAYKKRLYARAIGLDPTVAGPQTAADRFRSYMDQSVATSHPKPSPFKPGASFVPVGTPGADQSQFGPSKR